jgi:bile acid:Na+ symporter, BASS family
MNLATLIPAVLKGSIFVGVFALGLEAGWKSAGSLFRRPGDLLRSVVALYLVMPILALALATRFELQLPVKIALLALSVSPIPPLLPKKELKAGGSKEYTIGLLMAAAILAVVVVPVALALFARYASAPLQTPIASIVNVVAITLLVPLMLGLLVQRAVPAFAARIAKPLAGISMVTLLAGVVPILFTAWPAIRALTGNGSVLAFAVFGVVGLVAGHLLAPGDREQRSVLALSTANRHPGVALSIASANFPGDKRVLAAVLLYLLVTMIVTLPYLTWTRRHNAKSRN